MISKRVRSRGLSSLEPVLWEWVYLVESICRQWDWKDCPWWYTERALIGTLAAAGWYTRGGIALEEYSNYRGKGADRYLGRCDLFVSIGHSEFIAEGKLSWCSVGSRARNGLSDLRKHLVEARADVRSLKR